jgi:hypothetical protein
MVVCSFNCRFVFFSKFKGSGSIWGGGCLWATVGFPRLWNPSIPGSVNKPRYFLGSAWTTDAKAFCKSFSVLTWLLWRTLQTKVPDDIACCGLGSYCVTHTNTWTIFFSHTRKKVRCKRAISTMTVAMCHLRHLLIPTGLITSAMFC